jgi:hypothetical protein
VCEVVTLGHTQDSHTLYVLPSHPETRQVHVHSKLAYTFLESSCHFADSVHTSAHQAHMHIMPDKHRCIFRSLHHKRKLPVFLPHPGVSGLDEGGGG